MSDAMNSLEIEDVYELSPLQEGMLFHTLMAPESGVYLEQLCVAVRGVWSQNAMKRALEQLLQRHSILRTAFCWEGLDKPAQIVFRSVAPLVETIEPEQFPELGGDIEALLLTDRRRAFKLDQPPLFRLTSVRSGPDSYWLILTFHHLLLDGWSLQRLTAELTALYEAAWEGRDAALPTARPYRDYIAWRQAQNDEAARRFWTGRLADFWSPTLLAPSAAADATVYSEYNDNVPASVTAELKQFAQRHRMTLNTVVQAAWAVVLGRNTASDDVVFGSVVSGRPATLPGVESILGLFINTIPVRARLAPESRVIDWLTNFHAEQLAAREFEHTSLVDIQGWSRIPRSDPLFDTIVGLENYPVGDRRRHRAGAPTAVRHFQRTNYPLAIAVLPGDQLELIFLYDGSFDRRTVERLARQYVRVMEGILTNPDGRVCDLPLLTDAERERLLVGWNATQCDYPEDRTLADLFEAQVEASPAAVAVSNGTDSLTYSDLNARANQLAMHLREMGIGPEDLVAIAVERSFEMIVAVLGVLKAGGAYVPLDTAYPSERLAFMLEDTRAPVLLTQQRLVHQLPAYRGRIVCLDTEWPVIAANSPDNLSATAGPDNLAYVIYTSGSTGRPKGVMVEHRALANCLTDQRRAFGERADSRVLQFSSFSFDGWVFELMLAFGAGGRLCLASPDRLILGSELISTLREEQITSVLLPPSALAVLPDADVPTLRCLTVAGEACRAAVVTRWAPGRRFFNLYGPTETTCYCTYAEYDGPVDIVHIGRPISNTEIYILDTNRQVVDVGMSGEIYIGGAGLARGYLNRPELTTERFVDHPFSTVVGARLYRSGDVGRYLPDGNIEFLGRVDHQIKLRGFRVELGEIEAVLLEHGSVRESVVVTHEHSAGDPRLVAYVVMANGSMRVDELRAHLRRKLPEYMIPAAFVQLPSIPRLPSGKPNRAALPYADTIVSLPSVVAAPSTETEAAVAEIWKEILRIERAGIHDSFFDLGGHSLLVTQLISRLREAFRVELAFAQFFEAPTIAGVAAVIDTLRWMQGGPATAGESAVHGLEEGML